MAQNQATNTVIDQTKRTRVRWFIVTMLFIITTINYADRSIISIAAPALKADLSLSAVEMGFIFSAFAWSYVLCQLPGGWLLDRFGSRITYFFSIFIWSLFTVFQGGIGFFVGGAAVAMLFIMRLLVGAAEAPSFPANSNITAAWFPNHERGTAVAFYNSAQYFATVIFAPLMGWIVHSFGWRYVFCVMGVLGIIMAIVWIKTIYGPKEHPWVNQAELDYIESGGALMVMDGTKAATQTERVDTWSCIKELLGNRMLVGVYIGQYCITTLTYFFLTWFPVYLVQARGMTILKAGFVASLPAVCGFIGGVLGGIFSDFLLKKGYSLSISRKTPIVFGMLMSMSMILCNYIDIDWVIILIMSLAFFGKGVGALGWAVVSDTSPKEAGGLSGGLFNTFGNTAGITTPIIIGYIVQGTGNFAWALVFVAASAAVAILSYVFVVGEIKRVHLTKSLHAETK